MTWSPNLSPKERAGEKENLTESVRIKPSIYACTVYDLSIKSKGSLPKVVCFLNEYELFSTTAFLLLPAA